jgi:ankyrin repeat protein
MRGRYLLPMAAFVVLAVTLNGQKHYDETLTKDLVEAVRNKNVDSTKSLLARNADPNAVDEKKTPLLMAMLLRMEFSLNEATSGTIRGDKAASETGQIVKLLLAAGADPNARNAEGSPVLMAAIMRQDPGIMADLIRAGASAKAADSTGPLFVAAAFSGNQKIVELMLDAGADVNAKTKDGTTALLAATYKQKWDLSKYLIQKGADVNARLDVGSPLLFAAAAGDLGTVKLLVEKGAEINAKDSEGISPLSAAQKRNHQEVVDFLGTRKSSPGVIAIASFEVSVLKSVSIPDYHIPEVNSPFLGAGSHTHYNMALMLQVTNTGQDVARLNDEQLKVQVVDDTNARHDALGYTPIEISQASAVEGRLQTSAEIDPKTHLGTIKHIYTLPNGDRVNAQMVFDNTGRLRWTLVLPAGKPTIVTCIFDIPAGRKAVQLAIAGVQTLMPLPDTSQPVL